MAEPREVSTVIGRLKESGEDRRDNPPRTVSDGSESAHYVYPVPGLTGQAEG